MQYQPDLVLHIKYEGHLYGKAGHHLPYNRTVWAHDTVAITTPVPPGHVGGV